MAVTQGEGLINSDNIRRPDEGEGGRLTVARIRDAERGFNLAVDAEATEAAIPQDFLTAYADEIRRRMDENIMTAAINPSIRADANRAGMTQTVGFSHLMDATRYSPLVSPRPAPISVEIRHRIYHRPDRQAHTMVSDALLPGASPETGHIQTATDIDVDHMIHRHRDAADLLMTHLQSHVRSLRRLAHEDHGDRYELTQGNTEQLLRSFMPMQQTMGTTRMDEDAVLRANMEVTASLHRRDRVPPTEEKDLSVSIDEVDGPAVAQTQFTGKDQQDSHRSVFGNPVEW